MKEYPVNILIIGGGMYVCGRGTSGYGTVLPALCEWRRQGKPLGRVCLAVTSEGSSLSIDKRLSALNRMMKTDLKVDYFYGEEGGDPAAGYLEALKQMPAPAGAVIVVPDHLHFQVARDCIRSGVHPLVVKPLTPTVAEADELIELARTHGVYGAVEFHKRFDRANLKLKEVIRSGVIGDPLYFLVEYSQRKSVPSSLFSQWVNLTNIFQYLGVHYVDIIHFVTGALPVRACAQGQSGWLAARGIDTFDAVHGIVEWKLPDGPRFNAYIHTNWIDPETTSAMSDQRIKVIGTMGRFESDQKNRGIEVTTDSGGVEHINPDFCTTYPGPDGGTSYQGYGITSIHTFLGDIMSLQTGERTLDSLKNCRPTFENSLSSTAVVEAVNQSLESNGNWIDITIEQRSQKP